MRGGTTREDHLGPEGREPPLDTTADIGQDHGLGLGELRVGVGAAGIEHDDLAGHAAALLVERVHLAHAQRVAVADGAGEALKRPVRREPAHAVSLESDIALELAEGGVGQLAEDAIGAPTVEAHARQASLEVHDVIPADEVARGEGKNAITQTPTGFLQVPEGLRSDDAVHGDATLLLEGAHSLIDRVIEIIAGGRLEQAEASEALADIGYFRAGVPSLQEGRRHAPSTYR